MSSVQYLKEFVNERLTAAAEEIFGVFEKTIVEYEEVIDRQRRLLDVVWKPEIKSPSLELPQQHDCKEDEILADQQLCVQERSSGPDQEEPEPPQIKEEQEELCTSQEGEQLELKQETDAFMLIPPYEESDDSEDDTLNFNIDETQNVVAENSQNYFSDKSSVVSETQSDHQLLSHSYDEAESQNQTGGKHQKSNSRNNNTSRIHHNTHKGKKSFKCDTCGKRLSDKSALNAHMRIHTGERPFSCKTCGKAFRFRSHLTNHMITHTGEKSYSCNTCGKKFRGNSDLIVHIRTHTGEKPFTCKTCGKAFSRRNILVVHMRLHTGEKPYCCKTCGENFIDNRDLLVHMRRAHTGEKPYLCKTCGKSYFRASHLARHVRSHAGE
ncbi:zinc finger protein OZF-like [Plectropomus leopardus]|uniref:zinc finger protein OZF-like n=1 Tax=Plectropomus leopardus TaxID=160734 RepID=UPI001C4D09C9|nr:zinc finger protein OZF-like [Plectropomus leopardus]